MRWMVNATPRPLYPRERPGTHCVGDWVGPSSGLEVWYIYTIFIYIIYIYICRGTRWRSWLRHYATNRKVAGSIPDGVIEFSRRHNTSGRTMALGSTQPLTEMSTRNVSWGKGGRSVGLTTLPPSCADCLEMWEPQPPGTLKACPGL